MTRVFALLLLLLGGNDVPPAAPLKITGLERFVAKSGKVWLRGYVEVNERHFADGKIPIRYTIQAMDAIQEWDVAMIVWRENFNRSIQCGSLQRAWIEFGTRGPLEAAISPQPVTLEVLLEYAGHPDHERYAIQIEDFLGDGQRVMPEINELVRLEVAPSMGCWKVDRK